MTAQLHTGVFVYSTQDPEADALLVDGGEIAWIGPQDTALALYPDAERHHWSGSLLTPSFVDAVPTADGSEPDETWQREALAHGVTGAVAGPEGMREGILAVAPAATPGTRFLELAAEGTPLAFGSGGAAHRDPWAWVRAAAHEGPQDQRISDRAAFLAATRGSRRLAGIMHPGSLNPGAPATFVVWEPWDLTVRGQDERIQTWSTDPRSRTPLLPDLSQGVPRALRTVVEGRVVHDSGDTVAP